MSVTRFIALLVMVTTFALVDRAASTKTTDVSEENRPKSAGTTPGSSDVTPASDDTTRLRSSNSTVEAIEERGELLKLSSNSFEPLFKAIKKWRNDSIKHLSEYLEKAINLEKATNLEKAINLEKATNLEKTTMNKEAEVYHVDDKILISVLKRAGKEAGVTFSNNDIGIILKQLKLPIDEPAPVVPQLPIDEPAAVVPQLPIDEPAAVVPQLPTEATLKRQANDVLPGEPTKKSHKRKKMSVDIADRIPSGIKEKLTADTKEKLSLDIPAEPPSLVKHEVVHHDQRDKMDFDKIVITPAKESVAATEYFAQRRDMSYLERADLEKWLSKYVIRDTAIAVRLADGNRMDKLTAYEFVTILAINLRDMYIRQLFPHWYSSHSTDVAHALKNEFHLQDLALKYYLEEFDNFCQFVEVNGQRRFAENLGL